MQKIRTVFKRDEKTKKVMNVLDVEFDFSKAAATEKLDGTNVRVTVRNHTAVRLEKETQSVQVSKSNGIIEPWYVDADENDPADKWLFDALVNTDLSGIPDGEHSAEALGTNIQGNSLNLDRNVLFFFSVSSEVNKITFTNVPADFEELKVWLQDQESLFAGNGSPIEGIVWHSENGEMVKIKTKDFDR